jgi:hypothetical protein
MPHHEHHAPPDLCSHGSEYAFFSQPTEVSSATTLSPKEGREGDEQAAYAAAAWLQRADLNGSLGSFINPPLTPEDERLLTLRVGCSVSCEHRLSASAQPLYGWHGMTSAVPLRTGILLSAPQQGRCIQCE